MTITCPNCNHSANTERAINPGTRIKCRKCQHLWAYQSPSGWENLKRQVNIGAKAFGRELGMCRGKFHKTDSGRSDLAPPPIIMFALSKLVFKFLFLGVLTVIALAWMPTEGEPANHMAIDTITLSVVDSILPLDFKVIPISRGSTHAPSTLADLWT
jgi:hypothetical protein